MVRELALSVNGIGGKPVLANDVWPSYKFVGADLGTLVSAGLNIAFYAGGMFAFLFALWGAFQYITAGGNKENLAKARNRIIWSIIGFVFIVCAFTLSNYISQAIPHNNNVNIQRVTPP